METLDSQDLLAYINKNFIDGTKHKIVFNKIRSSYLVVKLNAINGERLYNFSARYHNKVPGLKFDLELDKEYYLYEKDLYHFNKMDANEQTNYLQTVRYNGEYIGIIEHSKMKTMLQSLIKENIEYIIEVQSSNVTDTLWWVTTSNMPNGEELAIWSTSILDGKIEVTINDEIKNEKNLSFYAESMELLNAINDSSGMISLVEQKEDTNKKSGCFSKIYIRAYVLDTSAGLHSESIFACYYTRENSRTYAKLFLGKEVSKELGSNLNINNCFVISIGEFNKKLNTLCEALLESKKYYKIGEAIQSCLDKQPVLI